jgi:hypothetical protein
VPFSYWHDYCRALFPVALPSKPEFIARKNLNYRNKKNAKKVLVFHKNDFFITQKK